MIEMILELMTLVVRLLVLLGMQLIRMPGMLSGLLWKLILVLKLVQLVIILPL
jgi:hypothetical protein